MTIKIDWATLEVKADVTVGIGKVYLPAPNAVSLAPNVDGMVTYLERLLSEGTKAFGGKRDAFQDMLNEYFKYRVLQMVGMDTAQVAWEDGKLTGIKSRVEILETGYPPEGGSHE